MEEYNCRTCLAITDKKQCAEVTQQCYLEKSIKEVVLYLLPEMVSTLSDDEVVCANCFNTLQLVMKFIERCLEVEAIHAENKDYYEDSIDGLSHIQDGNVYYEVGIDESQNSVEVLDIPNDKDEHKIDAGELILLKSASQVQMDHDYLVKDELEVKSETEDGDSEVNLTYLKDQGNECNINLCEYSTNISTEIVTDSSFIPINQEQVEGNDNLQQPIEIVFDDSYILYDANAGDQENIELQSDSMTENTEDIQSEDNDMDDEDQDNLNCLTCDKVFTSKTEYKCHLNHHPPYICHYCGKGLKTESSYARHISWHTEGNSSNSICEFCGKCFKARNALSFHISNVHQDERPYMCDKCPKRFKNKFKLQAHMKLVHFKIGRQQCQECGKMFQNKEACESHYRLIHLRIKPFVCDICGLEFGRKDYLQKHIYHHSGEPRPRKERSNSERPPKLRLKNPGTPVVCKVCGKQITTVHLLKAHLQTHVRIKRHKCKHCELTFTLSTNRDRHEKLHESDPENKFRCNICWKRVKTEDDLERHVAGHSNRPAQHSCDICGERFHRRYLLDNHLLDKHTAPGDIEKAEEEIVLKNLLEYADPKLLN